MKVVNSYIFRAVCAILVGILVLSNPERMTILLVQVIGGLFLISGLVSMINYFILRYSDKVVVKPIFPIVGLGSFLFGAVLGFFPALFISYMVYVLCGLIVVAGVNQIWNMIVLRKVIPFRWYTLVMALLVSALGVLVCVIFDPVEIASLPFVLIGVGFVLYGVAEVVNGVRWRKYLKIQKRLEKEAAAQVVEEPETAE